MTWHSDQDRDVIDEKNKADLFFSKKNTQKTKITLLFIDIKENTSYPQQAKSTRK